MGNVSDKCYRQNQNEYILCSTTFFEYRAVYEITWKNMVELDELQMTIKDGACAWHAG
jgi:hypothetical protein